MTVNIPQKAGFMPTQKEWDDLVRIAENLGAQVMQRDAALRQMQSERDAARAEVARLTAALAEYGWHLDGCPAADCSTTKCECGYAALRQPAPSPATKE